MTIRKFTAIVSIFMAQATGVAAAFLITAGFSYMYGSGYGLHPALAGAGFVIVLAFPYIVEDRI